MGRKSTSVKTGFVFPSARCNRPRGGAFIAYALAIASLWGCQSTPQGGIDGRTYEEIALTSADRSFLHMAATIGGGRDGEVFFSFDRWPDGRKRVQSLIPEDVATPETLEKVRRLWAGFTGDQFFVMLHVDVSRFFSSIALNARGWNRIDWGVWRHPVTGATVSFYPGRIWLFTSGASIGDSGRISQLPPRLLTWNAENGITGGSGMIAGMGVLSVPPIEQIPEQITPEELYFQIFEDESVTAVLIFRDEFLARIALVPLRLRGRVLAEAFGFVLEDEFDILREGSAIIMRGIRLGDVNDLLPTTYDDDRTDLGRVYADGD